MEVHRTLAEVMFGPTFDPWAVCSQIGAFAFDAELCSASTRRWVWRMVLRLREGSLSASNRRFAGALRRWLTSVIPASRRPVDRISPRRGQTRRARARCPFAHRLWTPRLRRLRHAHLPIFVLLFNTERAPQCGHLLRHSAETVFLQFGVIRQVYWHLLILEHLVRAPWSGGAVIFGHWYLGHCIWCSCLGHILPRPFPRGG